VAGVFLLVLANRSPHRIRGGDAGATNPWLLRMAAGIGVLLLAVTTLPWLRGVMHFAVPDPTSLLATAAMLGVSGVWLWGLRRGPLGRAQGAARPVR
jgi:hypothetical protein